MIMKRKIILSLLIISCQLYIAGAQTVEAWEVRINNRQPIKKVIETIGVKPGMVIGEIGAGTGRVTVWLAKEVGPSGMIYANDIDKSSLNQLEARCEKEGFTNVKIIIGEVDNPLFPAKSLDVAFMTNTYHHLEKPVDLVRNILPALKENGILAIVERDADRTRYSSEATSKEKFVQQMQQAGFEVYLTDTTMSEDNIYLARPVKK
jgi:ubiquinone/menaquinone biosynthesis C-methylase UbiE